MTSAHAVRRQPRRNCVVAAERANCLGGRHSADTRPHLNDWSAHYSRPSVKLLLCLRACSYVSTRASHRLVLNMQIDENRAIPARFFHTRALPLSLPSISSLLSMFILRSGDGSDGRRLGHTLTIEKTSELSTIIPIRGIVAGPHSPLLS